MTPSDSIEIPRVRALGTAALDPDASVWARGKGARIALQPSPAAMAAAVSTYLAQSSGHGRLRSLGLRLVHDGEFLAVRLSWPDPSRDDRIDDLDRFVDAAAVMFPLADAAEPLTMGSAEAPVNIWFWKADRSEPFDVVARGYSTSQKRPASSSGLEARARHANGEWDLVFRRPLAARGAETVDLAPGGATRLAFAVWDGANAERAGQKSASAVFTPVVLAP